MVNNSTSCDMGERINKYTLYNDDCFNILPTIKDNSIDLILCDLPYGCFKNIKWDKCLDSKILFNHYNRILKDTGNIVLFSQGIFTAKMILANEKYYRYNLVWKKGYRITAPILANKQPLRNHEDIIVYYKTGKATYNPQFEYVNRKVDKGGAVENQYIMILKAMRERKQIIYTRRVF